jgi:iron(III) transport system substrate-binding protein
MNTPRLALLVLWGPLLAGSAGCWTAGEPQVVVYTAQDAEFAEPVFRDFAAAQGVQVRPKFDTEATKTVGLAEAIVAEAQRPRCDVFWNNEVLHAVRLARRGLLEVYQPARAGEFPSWSRAPDGTWHGFAARARVLLVNTELVAEPERPRSIRDLADPRWRGRAGLAKPLFGTTATHAACLFAAWGAGPARSFFDQVHGNVQVLPGNRHVAQAVARGQLAFGLTDTDDAAIELARRAPVEVVYPDQGAGELGTLFIPNTLAIVKGGPHPEQARRLLDYLLTPEVETRLAAGPSAQIPLHPGATPPAQIRSPAEVRAMEVDFAQAGEMWETAAGYLRERFAAP